MAYIWYLNGESIATGDTYAIDGLSTGIYRIDVTAITSDGDRAGSASGTTGATQVRILLSTDSSNWTLLGISPPANYLGYSSVTVANTISLNGNALYVRAQTVNQTSACIFIEKLNIHVVSQ